MVTIGESDHIKHGRHMDPTTKCMVGTKAFIDMIRLSENNTQAVFAGAYANMVAQTRQPIRDFYSSLVSYIYGRNSVNLENVVRTFFDELFPPFYYTRVDPKVKGSKSSYNECLKSARTKIEPFGDIPKKTAEHITKSFNAAHTLLQALNLGIEVINTTDHSTIDPECSKQLTRLVYCPHCQLGLVNAKPCNGYCLNVIRGCLSNIAELDQPWNDYVTAMSSMTSLMKGAFNIEDAMAHLDQRITEGIQYATNLAPNIKQQGLALQRLQPKGIEVTLAAGLHHLQI
ncbi:Glypican-5 [Nymphon striatum]|nr:Glypican-5 [Nymphon striatum]